MIRKILGILCIALFIGGAFAAAEAKSVNKYDYKIVSQNGEEVYITGNFGNYNEAQDKGKNRVTFYNASVYDKDGNLVGVAEVINYNAKSNNGAHVKWAQTHEEVETPEEVVNETTDVVNESSEEHVVENTTNITEEEVIENSTSPEEIIINETTNDPVEDVVNSSEEQVVEEVVNDTNEDSPVIVDNTTDDIPVVIANNTAINAPEVNNTAVVQDLNSTPDKLVDNDTVDNDNSTEDLDNEIPMEKTGVGLALVVVAIALVAIVYVGKR